MGTSLICLNDHKCVAEAANQRVTAVSFAANSDFLEILRHYFNAKKSRFKFCCVCKFQTTWRKNINTSMWIHGRRMKGYFVTRSETRSIYILIIIF